MCLAAALARVWYSHGVDAGFAIFRQFVARAQFLYTISSGVWLCFRPTAAALGVRTVSLIVTEWHSGSQPRFRCSFVQSQGLTDPQLFSHNWRRLLHIHNLNFLDDAR